MRKVLRIFILVFFMVFLGVTTVTARNFHKPVDDITIGGQLYDKWFAVLGVNAPEGNMPIWERQSSNTRSGPDTWRCSECHGWDYKGSQGAYKTGSHATGFPAVMKIDLTMTKEEIVDILKGSKDPAHNFSTYIKDEDLSKLASFIKNGVQDDSTHVDAHTLKAIGGDLVNGEKLFIGNCSKCHGADGKLIVFRTDGVNEFIGSIANRDPYRFLHRTRFGVSGAKDMPIGRDLGWNTSESVDLLAFAQRLPTGVEIVQGTNAGTGSKPSPNLGGPQGGIVGGFFTGFAAVFGMLGFSFSFLFLLVIFGALIVWALRKRN